MKSIRFPRLAAAAALTAVCLMGLASCSNNASSGTAVTVNGTAISEQKITDYIQAFRDAQSYTDADTWGKWLAQSNLTPSKVRDEVINYYEQIELTRQAAEENGVSVSDEDVDAQVQTMKANYSDDTAWQNALKQAGTTEDQYRESVRNAMLAEELKKVVVSDSTDPSDEDLLTRAQQYATAFTGAKRSSHILFASDDEATAQQVLDDINAGKISFEDAAKQYSTDTASAENGGDVGWDLLNSFVSEYTTALSDLEKDQVSGLVTSQFGIHIIKCTDVFTAPQEITSLDQLPSEFVEYIRTMVKSNNGATAYQTWFDDYKNNADIQKNDMPSGLPYDVDMSKYQTDQADNAGTTDDPTVNPSEDAPADTQSDASAETAPGDGSSSDEASQQSSVPEQAPAEGSSSASLN